MKSAGLPGNPVNTFAVSLRDAPRRTDFTMQTHTDAAPRTLPILLVLTFLAGVVCSDFARASELTGPYFGQEPPGFEAEIFAPGLISREGVTSSPSASRREGSGCCLPFRPKRERSR